MSPKAVTALVFLIVGLLAVVIFVGLAQKTLNTTGVAVSLTSIITGYFGHLALKAAKKDDEK